MTVDIKDHFLGVTQKLGNLFGGDLRHLIAELRAIVVSEYVGSEPLYGLLALEFLCLWVIPDSHVHGCYDGVPHSPEGRLGHHLGIPSMEQVGRGALFHIWFYSWSQRGGNGNGPHASLGFGIRLEHGIVPVKDYNLGDADIIPLPVEIKPRECQGFLPPEPAAVKEGKKSILHGRQLHLRKSLLLDVCEGPFARFLILWQGNVRCDVLKGRTGQ